jgi:guanylate kinase
VSNSSESPSAEPRLVVLIGPGGTGKGTVAARLVEADDRLWLSRSWTTRPPREGEHPEAYVFVDRASFEAHHAGGGFLESAEFLGNLYGTPVPEVPEEREVLLEIELEGARQVLARRPDATVILLVPPSEEHQEARLRGRGDPDEHVVRRIEKGRQELAEGRQIAHHEVVNEDLEQAVGEVLGILASLRLSATPRPAQGAPPMSVKRATLMDPPIEELLDKVDSKFTLVTLGAKRAREINAYYHGLGEVLGQVIPPQVTSVSGKPLSIAFEEIAASKVTYHHPDPEELAAEAAAASDAEALGFHVDPFAVIEGDAGLVQDLMDVVGAPAATDEVDDAS